MATTTDLSPKQHRALAALMSSPNVKAAAETALVGERTLWRWIQDDPDFIEAYRVTRGQIVSQAVALVQGLMSVAVETLRSVMSDIDAPASARVSAAKTALEMGLKGRETEDIESLLIAIEKRIENR